MWEELLLFLVPFTFLRRFDVFLELVILAYINAIFIDFLCGKVLNLHLLCVIAMFISGEKLV